MTAPPPVPRGPRDVDTDHLKLLAIFHFIFAGLAVVGIGFLFLHWTFMHAIFDNAALWKDQKGTPPPKELLHIFRWFYLCFGVAIIIGGILNLLSGLCIRKRRGRLFSLVVAGIDVLQFPFGTALGIFSFIILLRGSVVALYTDAKAPRTTP